MNQSTFGMADNPILRTCGSMTGVQVTFVASRPGNVIVTASVLVTLTHTAGNLTAADLHLGNSTTDCTGVGAYAITTGSHPAGFYYIEVSLVRGFTVPAAGTYTYYVTGYDYSQGTDSSNFGWATVVGVYYPS